MNSLTSLFTRMIPYKFTGESDPCNLCGSRDRRIVGKRDRYGHRLYTVMCKNCGLVFLDPMPTEEEVNLYYTRFYRKHYHNVETPRKKDVISAFHGARLRYELIAPVIKENSKVLDVGAGGGEFTAYLCRQGIDAKGIEPNEGYARYARETYEIPVLNTTWGSADIEPGSIGVVTANHVVEHFRSPYHALKCFRDWLKPNGYLFLSVPNVINPRRTPYSRFHFAHLYYFTPITLRMMANKVGFKETDICTNDDTTIVLQKVDEPTTDWFYAPGHAKEVDIYFRTYTNKRYFLRPDPYLRWTRRMIRLIRKRLAGTFVTNAGIK